MRTDIARIAVLMVEGVIAVQFPPIDLGVGLYFG